MSFLPASARAFSLRPVLNRPIIFSSPANGIPTARLLLILRQPTPSLRNYASKAGKKAKKTISQKPTPTKPAAAADAPTSAPPVSNYRPLTQRLGELGRETMLYNYYPKAFIRTCYWGSAICALWATYNWQMNYEDPWPGTPNWLKMFHGGCSVVVMGCAVWAAVRPHGVIQRITTLPVAATSSSPASVKLQLHVRSHFPLLPPKRLTFEHPSKLTLTTPFHRTTVPDAAELAYTAPDTRGFGRKVRDALSPFQQIERLKDMLSRRDFVRVTSEDGHQFWLHRKGWVWERRGLDALLAKEKAAVHWAV